MFDYFTGFLLIYLSFFVMIYLCPHTFSPNHEDPKLDFLPKRSKKQKSAEGVCWGQPQTTWPTAGTSFIGQRLSTCLTRLPEPLVSRRVLIFDCRWMCSHCVALLMAVMASLVISLQTVGNNVDCVQDWTKPTAAWLAETVIGQMMTPVPLTARILDLCSHSYVTELLATKTLQPFSHVISLNCFWFFIFCIFQLFRVM